jgi:tetratricopeptide (TPR) repeat protein
LSGRPNDNDLVNRIKSIIPYLNGDYKDFGPKRMQNDRYLILLYGATMIDEFKQRGTKHRRLLYFSYNQLKKISKSPILDPPVGRPLRFESTRTARNKVYPELKKKGYVRIEKIDIESGGHGQCVAIIKKGIDAAKKRLNEIWNGFSTQIPEQQQLAKQEDKGPDEKLKDPYQNYGLNRLTTDYFKSHESMQKVFDEWENGFSFDLPSIKARRELRRESLIDDIKSKLENGGKLLIVGQSGTSKTTILMELMCNYFDSGYEVLYNYGIADIRNVDGLVNYIEYLLRQDKKLLVAIDNAHKEKTYSIFYLIDKLSTSLLGKKLKIVMTARKPEFDWLLNGLEEVEEEIRKSIRKLYADSNFIYQLPYFNKEEIKEFIKRYSGTVDEKIIDKRAEDIYNYTKGDPVMVKFSVFGKGLEQDVAEMSDRYLRSKVERKTMLICSLLDISNTEITDNLLEKCGIVETAHNLDGSILRRNSDGTWNTKHPRWDLELFSFLYKENNRALLERRKQDLKDSLITLYSMKKEDIIYLAVQTLYSIAAQNFVPINLVESVFQQSISQISRYLSKEKQSNLYTYHIADAYYELRKYGEAIDKLGEALRLNSLNVTAYNIKGIALMKLGRYSEAIECFDKALEIDPTLASLWMNRGNTLDDTRNYIEVMKSYCKVLGIEIDPTSAAVMWNIRDVELKKDGDPYRKSVEMEMRIIDNVLAISLIDLISS